LLPPPAVAQGDGNGAFRIVLTDDVAVKLRDNLARAEGVAGHSESFSTVILSLV